MEHIFSYKHIPHFASSKSSFPSPLDSSSQHILDINPDSGSESLSSILSSTLSPTSPYSPITSISVSKSAYPLLPVVPPLRRSTRVTHLPSYL